MCCAVCACMCAHGCGGERASQVLRCLSLLFETGVYHLWSGMLLVSQAASPVALPVPASQLTTARFTRV